MSGRRRARPDLLTLIDCLFLMPDARSPSRAHAQWCVPRGYVGFALAPATKMNNSDYSAVVISRLRSSALYHPFNLVCYCASVFLQAAFHSVRVHACMSVFDAPQCSSCGHS
ncbi:hypothetical protein EVAR_66764_1 [Eumeta japonica]|uniref:Uncharacterized protein n=1 Tax=Eumeta variegata TaxID=151549 RepID=A0A4C1Z7V0_EUMVA|nr:hypothetical protein EVAR_66764_1 [Eumeta japonica]